jgi:hypothetical protein
VQSVTIESGGFEEADPQNNQPFPLSSRWKALQNPLKIRKNGGFDNAHLQKLMTYHPTNWRVAGNRDLGPRLEEPTHM